MVILGLRGLRLSFGNLRILQYNSSYKGVRMDQSKSSNTGGQAAATVPMPHRTFSVEFIVGLFAIVAVVCGGYLSVGLGDIRILPSNEYNIFAEFDNVSGLKTGASVEIAGVQVGQVTNIDLKDSVARLTLSLDKAISIRDDDMALIRTKGIIGDRYVKLSRGASANFLKPGDTIVETESVVDIEDLIGKFIHNMDSGKSSE
ncbi:MAG: outer membrane lipid asymmetry maintenance protein MlaD [Proteobacteria bacterium]|nr:outer membrane lipid asymmetry maintenance protein MlaD [Pseudomonadota bacterium]